MKALVAYTGGPKFNSWAPMYKKMVWLCAFVITMLWAAVTRGLVGLDKCQLSTNFSKRSYPKEIKQRVIKKSTKSPSLAFMHTDVHA